MTPSIQHRTPVHSPRTIEALEWAAQLHLGQISALVWEDGGDEEQAIAALLHDAIEDAGVSADQIAERYRSAEAWGYGERVARIVVDCTDTAGPPRAGERREPWLVRKRRDLDQLQVVDLASLQVSAADKALNAREQMLDARMDPETWSRSTELLGEALQEMLASKTYRQLVPEGIAPAVWAAGYPERQVTAAIR